LEFKLQLVRVSDTLKLELQPGNMPLLTELGIFLRGGGYNDAAPTALKQNRCNHALLEDGFSDGVNLCQQCWHFWRRDYCALKERTV